MVITGDLLQRTQHIMFIAAVIKENIWSVVGGTACVVQMELPQVSLVHYHFSYCRGHGPRISGGFRESIYAHLVICRLISTFQIELPQRLR